MKSEFVKTGVYLDHNNGHGYYYRIETAEEAKMFMKEISESSIDTMYVERIIRLVEKDIHCFRFYYDENGRLHFNIGVPDDVYGIAGLKMLRPTDTIFQNLL